MKKKWLQKVTAVALVAAMCFGIAPGNGFGGVLAKAEETGAVVVWSDDMEADADELWNITWSDAAGTNARKSDEFATNNATKFWNFYSESAQTVTISRQIDVTEAGNYYAQVDVSGENFTGTVSVESGADSQSANLAFGGWDDFQTTSTNVMTIAANESVTVKVTVDLTAGAWFDLDNFCLMIEKAENDAVEWQTTSYVVNGDFESNNTDGWSFTYENDGDTIGYVVKTDSYAENNKTHMLNVWNNTDTAAAFTMEQTVSNVPAGTYKLAIDVEGVAASSDLSVNANDVVFTIPDTTGWDKWTTLESNSFELAESGDVTIKIAGNMPANYWIDFDNIVLMSVVTSDDTADIVDGDLNITKVPDLSSDFIMGMDISSVISLFDSGVTFKDYEGNTIDNVTDFCKFLASQGITHIRVRVWNNPYDSNGNGYGGGNNDVAKAKQIAEGCRAAGIKMLVDFHCSDLWTDPSKQQAPKAWQGYSVEEKAAALTAYLTDALNTIDADKDTVAMVQVGNETTSGFVGESDEVAMCKLFSAGAAGVRAYNPNVKVVIHVTNPEKGKVTTWAKNLSDNSVDYDIIATSYYPYWHGTFANLKREFQTVKNTYNKDVMVAETSYAYTLEDSDGHDNTVRVGNNDIGGNCTQPFTVQGQATSIRNLINLVNEAGGLGVFYWEPAWLTVGDTRGLEGADYDAQVAANKEKWEKYGSGWASSYAAEYDAKDAGKWFGGTAVDNEAMFYPDGTPTAGLHVWNYVKTGAVNKTVSIDAVGTAEETIEAGKQYTLPETVTISYNTGDKEDSVTWNSADIEGIDTQKTGTYVVRGTVIFSQEITAGTYKGQTTADTTYTLTVIAPNLITDANDAGFEKGGNFVIGGSGISKIPAKDDPYTGSGSMHWYCATAATGNVIYQTGITLQAGTYAFEAKAQGNENDTVALNILDTQDGSGTVLSAGEAVAMSGWKNWQTPKVSFTLTEETTVYLQVVVNIQAGGWGTADELYLYGMPADEEEGGTTTPPEEGGTTTPPEEGGTTTPPEEGGTTTPPEEGSGSTTTPGAGSGSTTTPGAGSGSVTTPGAGSGSTATPGTGSGSTTTPGTGNDTSSSVPEIPDKAPDVQVTTNPDGTVTEVTTGSNVNEAGKSVETTITIQKDVNGNVTAATEKSVILNAAKTASVEVTVEKNADGAVSDAAADITKIGANQKSGTTATLFGSVVSQITEAAGTDSVRVTMTVVDSEGNIRYTVRANTKDLRSGEKMNVVAIDSKTGAYVLVNDKTYTVSDAGNVKMVLKDGAVYELLPVKAAKAAEKQILKTVRAKKTDVSVKKGKTAAFALSSKLNMDNVKKITYSTSKKTVAVVNKNGRITAKKPGAASIKAKVMLKNGTTKTVTMKVKVK